MVAGALEGLAQATLHGGNAAEAVRFIAGAAVLRSQIGTPVRPINLPSIEQALATARKVLGEEIFARIWSEVHAQPLEQLLSTIRNATSPENAT